MSAIVPADFQIRIDLLAGIGFFSRLIEKYSGLGHYSHAASMLKDGRYLDARDNKIGDVPAGVHIRVAATETWTRRQSATLKVSQADYNLWEQGLRNQVTTEYDEDAILGFLEGRSLHTAGKWICSALAINGVQHMCRGWTGPSLLVEGMQRVGYIPFPLVLPAHEISPNELLLILQAAGFTIGPVELAPPKA